MRLWIILVSVWTFLCLFCSIFSHQYASLCDTTTTNQSMNSIGIPYALSNAGLVVGIAMLIFVAYLTDKSLRMIVELANFHPKLRHLGVFTYEDLARIPFGKFGAGFVLTVMFVLAYGAMVAYLLIIKDTVPTILGLSDAGKGNFIEAEVTMIVTSVLIVLPLSMMRDMVSVLYPNIHKCNVNPSGPLKMVLVCGDF